MGIFGNKQQNDTPVQDDQALQYGQANIDGVLPFQTNDPVQALAQADDFSQHAPALPPNDTIGTDYIMADAPAPAIPAAQNDTVWSDHQHDDGDIEQTATEPIGTHPEFFSEPEIEQSTPEAPAEIVDQAPETTPSEPETMQGSDSIGDLATIKQEALKQLSPLVNHLDQSPEERFHTTMMMLQATDDQTLVKPAYEAAQSIIDDRARAQALLDIVNEINYFTQKP